MDSGDLFRLLIVLVVLALIVYAAIAVFFPALSNVKGTAGTVGQGVGSAVNVIQSVKNLSNFTLGAFPALP